MARGDAKKAKKEAEAFELENSRLAAEVHKTQQEATAARAEAARRATPSQAKHESGVWFTLESTLSWLLLVALLSVAAVPSVETLLILQEEEVSLRSNAREWESVAGVIAELKEVMRMAIPSVADTD